MRRIVKPNYIDPIAFAGGQPLAYQPPLLFRNVSARVFPLKANIARLAEFCDEYLNLDVPDEIVHFTPALPYVYFMALNYGGMSATTLDRQRLGWVAQHEAFFLVPLNRWRREHGKLVFQGWTSMTPFMFVDDALSMMMGREVYGWPKTLGALEADRPAWANHPRADERLYTLATPMFREVYAGEREPMRELVTIDRDVIASFAEYPLNYHCPWSITSVVPNLYATSLSLMEEAADILANLRLRGFPDTRNADTLVEMAREGLSLYADALAGLSPWPLGELAGEPRSGTNARAAHVDGLPRYFSSTINRKQFRDPTDTQRACYSALVESAMGVDRLNAYGLLGDWDLLRGDPSGGFALNLSRYRAQPIVETLGINVPITNARAREGDVVTLRPSFPFWMDVDLYYGAGDVICSKTPRLADTWIEETEATGAAGRRRMGRARGRQPRRATEGAPYDTALGAATLPITGPLHFPDLTIAAYPLKARRAHLQALVDACWNGLFDDGRIRLEVASAYVYLTVSTVGDAYGRMWSESENIGWWADREAAFALPVRWYRDDKLVGLALIEPIAFANKPRAMATDREVNGRNTFLATIERPADVWSAPGGPGAPRHLTRVTAESFVELGYGLESKPLTLIEIDEGQGGDPPARQERDEAIDSGLAMARAWARGAPIRRLNLKQYRDAADFQRACYQAVVEAPRRIERVHAGGEIFPAPRVKLHRRANYPLAEVLGLEVERTRSGASVVDELTPVRPFWLRAGVVDDLGRVVATVDPSHAPDAPDGASRAWVFHDESPGEAADAWAERLDDVQAIVAAMLDEAR